MSLSFPQCGRACTGYIREFFHNFFDALSCLGVYIWLPIEDTRNSCRRNPCTFGDIANINSHSSPYTKTYSPSGERFLLTAHCNRCRHRCRHRLHKVYLPKVLLSRPGAPFIEGCVSFFCAACLLEGGRVEPTGGTLAKRKGVVQTVKERESKMQPEDLQQRWKEQGEEATAAIAQWRMAHPRATLAEIEQAIDLVAQPVGRSHGLRNEMKKRRKAGRWKTSAGRGEGLRLA